MRLRLISVAAVSLFSIAPSAAAQVNYDTVQVRSTLLNKNVYMLTGSGGNIGLSVADDAVFVIDDQFAPLTPKILAAIAAITPKPVRFVVNRHWHFDHTGGNENMGKTGAIILAHDNVRKRLAAGQFIEALNQRQDPAPPGALPVVTFAEGVTFHLSGDSIVVTHVPPAHTDGDAIIYFTKANVLHTGDVFHNLGLPFVDLSSGGSIDGFIGAADKMLAMTNASTKFVPGHGADCRSSAIAEVGEVLIALKAEMKKEIAAKKTIERVLADSITKPYVSLWPANHERFVRLLFQELTRK